MRLRPLTLILLCTLVACFRVEAQTCRTETEVPSTTPASRFQDNGDATVTDRSTGLMWAKSASGNW